MGACGLWLPIDSARELTVGDMVQYRLLLVNAWAGQLQKSTVRTATIEKQFLDDHGEPHTVLRHRDGALDCVEMSRLLDLRIRSFRGNAGHRIDDSLLTS